jgi:hypothetical protein
VALLIIWGATSFISWISTPAESSPTATNKIDPYLRSACYEFEDLYDDVSAGIITDAELREMARKVYEKAKSTSLEKSAEGLLRTITQGQAEEMQIHFTAMMTVCAPVLDR